MRDLAKDAGDAPAGGKDSLDGVLPAVYADLRRLAESHLRSERPNHTLQPTALVHEVYVRLAKQHSVDWHNRAHFFAIAAEMMRRILVNHATEKNALKRGAGEVINSLNDNFLFGPEMPLDILLLDEALGRLERLDRRQAKIIELRFFAGLTVPEIAQVLDVSEATVNREWRSAKAWIIAQVS